MIAVRMSHENMRDAFAAKRIPERLQMRRVVRPWIDHRNFIPADEGNARSFEGERAGIGCEKSAN